jgi:L-asparaginase
MKIYVAYTGGTIVMASSKGGYVPDAEFGDTIIGRLIAHQPEHEYQVQCYENLKDSSNATPADWQMIGNDIRSRWQEFDAFLILHGTDTMAYTSSALAFMFQNSRKPIVVTGSQIPLIKSRNDALTNVFGAVDALTQGPPGVFLYFGGLLLEGARARKINTNDLQAFQSPNHAPRGHLGVEWKWRKVPVADAPELIQIPVMESGAVTLMMLFPGVQVEHLQGLLGPQVKGAVLLSYGTGNGPDQNQALLDHFKQATDRGIVIVNVSQCGAGAVNTQAYAAGSALVKAGLTSGIDMTFEAAFVKLHFLIGVGKTPEQIRQVFAEPLAFENQSLIAS